jgi:hypothetical protein
MMPLRFIIYFTQMFYSKIWAFSRKYQGEKWQAFFVLEENVLPLANNMRNTTLHTLLSSAVLTVQGADCHHFHHSS